MKTKSYDTPSPNWLMHFFWKAAGADRQLLERTPYSDQIKYCCLGGVVLSTAVMAGIAGGYAFYIVLEPQSFIQKTDIHLNTLLMALLFSCIWGLIIFNLDRFLVSGSKRFDTKQHLSSFKKFTPRVIMGIILAITISKPLEVRIFKKEIDLALHQKKLKKQQLFVQEIDSIFDSRLKPHQDDIANWQQEILNAENQYALAEREFNQELKEKPNGSTSGYGPDARKKEELLEVRLSNLNEIRKRNQHYIDQSLSAIGTLKKQQENEVEKSLLVASSADGLAERIKLVHEVTSFWISFFITLLILAIELAPVFFKALMDQTTYDHLERNLHQLTLSKYKIQEGNTNVEETLIYKKLIFDKSLTEKELEIQTKTRLFKHALSVAEIKHIEKINQDPYSYTGDYIYDLIKKK